MKNKKYKDSASRVQNGARTDSAEAQPVLERKLKDSGIPWIGMIPEDWEVIIGKKIYISNDGGVWGNDAIGINDTIVLRSTEQDVDGNLFICNPAKRNLTEKEKSGALLKENDLIITKSSGSPSHIGKTSIISKEIEKLNCCYSNFLQRVRVQGCAKFYWYIFNSYVIKKQFEYLSTTTIGINNLNSKMIEALLFPIPPLPTQQRIADFLDRKCAEIDELAALQETMIAELKRYKQSVITEAVTKGLDKNVKFKDSGVEWIGDIPEGWEVCRLKQVTSKIGSGSTPTGGSNVYSKEGVKFIRSQNVYCEGFNLDDIVFISSEIDEMMKNTRVQINDILFNITGGSIGRCRFVDNTLGPANVNQHVCIIRPKNIQTKFLFYYLQSSIGQNQVQVLQTGGNREGLSASAFGLFKILLPPLSEQQAIADYLDEKCSEIDELIAIKQQKIEQLKEYKKSVIFEYVTGKKEV